MNENTIVGAQGGRAFTLVEVMISLGILALGAITLGAAYLNVVQNIHSASMIQMQAGGLRSARAILTSEPDKKKAERGGECDIQRDHLQWSATIDPTRVSDLFRVSIRVESTRGDSEGTWSRSETFMILRPSWSDLEERSRLLADAKSRLDRVAPSQ